MPQDKKFVEEITSMEEDLPSGIPMLLKADLADYSSVRAA